MQRSKFCLKCPKDKYQKLLKLIKDRYALILTIFTISAFVHIIQNLEGRISKEKKNFSLIRLNRFKYVSLKILQLWTSTQK